MNKIKRKIAYFTGNRKIPPEDLPMVKKMLREVLIQIIENGYRYFGEGGALSFDTLAALTVLELKTDYPEIKLILVLPCKDQTRGWKNIDIEKCKWIKSKADKVVYTSKHYYNSCMQKRNRHLVDNSSLCICYLTQKSGGTAYTVDYVKSKSKVLNIVLLSL